MFRASSAAGFFSANVINSALGAVAGVVIARTLGPHARGEFALCTALPLLIGPLAAAGLDVWYGRLPHSTEEQRRSVRQYAISSAGLAGMVSVMLCLAATYTYSLVIGQSFNIYWASAVLIAPLSTVATVSAGALIGLHMVIKYHLTRLSYFAANSLLLILMSFIGITSVLPYVYCNVAAALLSASMSVWYLTIGHDDRSGRFRLATDFSVAIRSSWTFGLASILRTLESRMPILLLGALAPANEVGIYVAAGSIAILQTSVGTAVGRSFYVRLLHGVEESAVQFVINRTRIAIVLLLSSSIIMSVVTPWLVPFLLGSKFAAAGGLLMLLVPAAGFSAMSMVGEDILKALGAGINLSIGRGAFSGGFLACGLPLCWLFGASGCATAVLCASVAQSCILWYWVLKCLGVGPAKLVPSMADFSWPAIELLRRIDGLMAAFKR